MPQYTFKALIDQGKGNPVLGWIETSEERDKKVKGIKAEAMERFGAGAQTTKKDSMDGHYKRRRDVERVDDLK